MFIQYSVNAGAKQNSLMADLVALITGQVTDVNSLSAACNKEFSEIIGNCTDWSTIGNDSYDSNSGATVRCLRALNEDGQSYKYAVLGLNANCMTYLGSCSNCDSNSNYVNRSKDSYRRLQGVNNANPFRLQIAVNKNAIVITGVDHQGTQLNVLAVVEFTRDDKWNTPASGNSAHCLMNSDFFNRNYQTYSGDGNTPIIVPKAMYSGGTIANLEYQLITPFGSTTPVNHTTGQVNNVYGYARGADNVTPEVVAGEGRIVCQRQEAQPNMNLGGKLLGGIKFCNSNVGIGGDELIIDGKHYIFTKYSFYVQESSRIGILVPKE